MIIEINDRMRIGDVCDAFAENFAYLKIEFFAQPHQWEQSSSLNGKITADKMIGQVRKLHDSGAIEIHAWQKTGSVEQEFRNVFGLHVQIFRREGSSWVQTVTTDQQTLEVQNEAGRNASQELLDGTDNIFNDENPFT